MVVPDERLTYPWQSQTGRCLLQLHTVITFEIIKHKQYEVTRVESIIPEYVMVSDGFTSILVDSGLMLE
jgi:hypothetical protein